MSKKRGLGLDWIWIDEPVQNDTRLKRAKNRAQTAEADNVRKLQIAEARKLGEATDVEEAIRKVAKFIHESQEEARKVTLAEESRKKREFQEAESQERYKRQLAYTSACTIVDVGTGTFCKCPGCKGLVEVVQIGCNRFTHEGEGGCWKSACLCCGVVFDTAKEVYDHLRRGDELAKRGLHNGCVTNYCKGKGCLACSIDNCHKVEVQPIAFDLFKF